MITDEQQTSGFDVCGPVASDATVAGRAQRYQAPRLTVLGTLADLTAGGLTDEDDGHGGAGASGVI